ncbi:MAG: phosphatase PAP2 family protein [Chloroflexota bacterium]|nr:phosphatase PAP2 family protein [Chloroflexota bacterium]
MPPLAAWSAWITSFVGKSPPLDYFMELLGSDFFIIVTICLIMLSLWLGHPNPARREHLQRHIMNASVAIGISSLVLIILKTWKFWPRPYELMESAELAVNSLYHTSFDHSFPSNVATVSFAAATGVWFGNRKAGAVLYVLAFLWSFARFYGGSHFVVDLVGGAMIGVVTAFMITKVFMPRIEPLPTWALRLARLLYIA